MTQSVVTTALKFLLVIAILTWLLLSGRLDFSLVAQLFSAGHYWVWGLAILALQDLISVFRWRTLLSVGLSSVPSFSSTLRLTWIGLFFNSFLPGVVTGDIVKIYYAKDLADGDKKISTGHLVGTVLLDRIFGLIGLILVVGISGALSYQLIAEKSPEMLHLLHFNFFLAAAACAFIASMFFPQAVQEKLTITLNSLPFVGNLLTRILKKFWEIGSHKRTVLFCISLGFTSQTLCFLGLWVLCFPFIGQQVSLIELSSFAPLGFLVTALPIAPAGLAVGHLAFESLFLMYGISTGASLFNLHYLTQSFINLMGMVCFLYTRGQKSIGLEIKSIRDIKKNLSDHS